MRILKYIPALLSFLAVASCGDGYELSTAGKGEAPVIQSFVIEKGNNPGLEEDVVCSIDGNRIRGVCRGIKAGGKVVPTFSGTFARAIVDGEPQISGETGIDASRTVRYILWNDEGRWSVYEAVIVTGNALPVVNIETDGTEPTYKDVKIPARIRISNVLEGGGTDLPATIKVRGNATSGYPKKPFKIKFAEKTSPLGFHANKDWVLLADYSDKSLLRTAWMNEVSKAVGMPYTPKYRHVELYMNGDYRGVYVLTDQVEKAKHRVNIGDDGFIIQNDNALSDELFYFTTDHRRYNYTFKYPDPDDGEIVVGDDNYNYMVGYMNNLESVLYSDGFADPGTGYRALIDPVTFAKWYLVFETTLNYEPNLYFVMEHKGAKLQMYPAWDGEWSLGLAYRPEAYGGWVRWPDGEPKPDDIFWSRGKYLGRLFEDPWFVSLVKEEWEKFKPQIPAVKEALRELTATLSLAQEDNFRRWPILDSGTHIGIGLVAFDTWQEETDYTFSVFDKRIETIESFLSSKL